MEKFKCPAPAIYGYSGIPIDVQAFEKAIPKPEPIKDIPTNKDIKEVLGEIYIYLLEQQIQAVNKMNKTTDNKEIAKCMTEIATLKKVGNFVIDKM